MAFAGRLSFLFLVGERCRTCCFVPYELVKNMRETGNPSDWGTFGFDFYDSRSWLFAIADLCLEIYFINFIDFLFQ